jgi:adenine-specific DNA-methyltransferase
MPRGKTTKPASTSTAPVDALRHQDKRKNIPTEELRDFVRDQENVPKTLLYPRDPSLDPQLVWKGKDEQDRADLAVPAVPIYIQEKIHPQAIIEDLRGQTRERTESQVSLFSDFNGIQFEELVDFYRHEQNWTNRMILGDSLLVMASLAEKEGLKGKVQMIYLDPPYGIKFGSNWQVSTRKRDVKDGKVEDATRQPEQVRAFRDTWELGIHSYLAYLRDRLVVARELLTETGSVFVQIGDENVHLVRCLMDEVFGSENFCAQIAFLKASSQTSQLITGTSDYLLWYAKDHERVKYHQLYWEKVAGSDVGEEYSQAINSKGERRPLTNQELEDGSKIPPDWKAFRPSPLTSQEFRTDTTVPFKHKGKAYHPGTSSHWKTTLEGMNRLALSDRILPRSDSLAFIRYLADFPVAAIGNIWDDTKWGFDAREKTYVVQTNIKVTSRALLMTTDPGDLVLDPTCGSGTTSFVSEQWGRRWITCDTSRVALALARTRLMAAKFPYYYLTDTPEGAAKEAEVIGRPAPRVRYTSDVRKGFVYKRVPHITLKSIAQNPDIQEGMTRAQIDESIARHAETEILHDKPYEDPKRVRVTGPFTVESLSPHRVLSTEEERPASERAAEVDPKAGKFEQMILDNLRRAGVQNTRKEERIKFDRLEPFPGTWIQALGEYPDATGKKRAVAVSIGPEHGTVGPEQVKEAAKEATRGLGVDLVVICGFAFDAHAGETAQQIAPAPAPKIRTRDAFTAAERAPVQYGKLTVLLAHMNPDLAMGEDLLKKTGTGNLFMVFGEPDLEVTTLEDGQLTVEVRGVDVYDPTTGQVRSASTDDIACWFLDTDYNGESFFVRHAYFTGADDPYAKLKRALKAQVDEAAWSALNSTVSRPFPPPKKGRIAVKVINHYGDEVMKVYSTPPLE